MGRFRQVKGAGSVLQAKGTARGKALSEGRRLKPVRKRKREQIRSVLLGLGAGAQTESGAPLGWLPRWSRQETTVALLRRKRMELRCI